MNKQIVLRVLRKELLERETELVSEKREMSLLWDVCDIKKKDNPYIKMAFLSLNDHKNQIRKLQVRLTKLRTTIKLVKHKE